jgi:NAD+ synthase (glutamine-hydrolysing)
MEQRGFSRALIGVSGGVDSAVTAYLAARALGPKHVTAVRMPYHSSSKESLEHAQQVIDALGLDSCTVDISAAVDGYLQNDPKSEPGRRGNVMARMRMIVLFDLSAKHRAIPLGTGNKTERLFGYFTWHADDAPPINPLGDLFKTQVWTLARHLGVPDAIVSKPPTADLFVGQTDEGDFGISYAKADEILNWMLAGYKPEELIDSTRLTALRACYRSKQHRWELGAWRSAFERTTPNAARQTVLLQYRRAEIELTSRSGLQPLSRPASPGRSVRALRPCWSRDGCP